MKKLITLVMLSIFAMTNVNAEEQTLWEGSTDINWGNSNVLIPTTEMAEVPVGATIRLSYELVDMPENYHAMRITTNWWGENPEDDLVAQFSLSSETPSTYEFIYSEACKALVDQREGMLIVGYGYKLTKVEAVTGSAGDEEVALWEGEHAIDWKTAWEPNSLDQPMLTKEEFAGYVVGQKLYFYFTTPNVEDYYLVRFTSWKQQEKGLGLDDYSVSYKATGTIKITLEVTDALKEKVAGTAEDGGFVISGHGVTVVKVSKPKEQTPTSIAGVKGQQTASMQYYNLRGQVVANPTKGLYIINGKKVVLK